MQNSAYISFTLCCLKGIRYTLEELGLLKTGNEVTWPQVSLAASQYCSQSKDSLREYRLSLNDRRLKRFVASVRCDDSDILHIPQRKTTPMRGWGVSLVRLWPRKWSTFNSPKITNWSSRNSTLGR